MPGTGMVLGFLLALVTVPTWPWVLPQRVDDWMCDPPRVRNGFPPLGRYCAQGGRSHGTPCRLVVAGLWFAFWMNPGPRPWGGGWPTSANRSNGIYFGFFNGAWWAPADKLRLAVDHVPAAIPTGGCSRSELGLDFQHLWPIDPHPRPAPHGSLERGSFPLPPRPAAAPHRSQYSARAAASTSTCVSVKPRRHRRIHGVGRRRTGRTGTARRRRGARGSPGPHRRRCAGQLATVSLFSSRFLTGRPHIHRAGAGGAG